MKKMDLETAEQAIGLGALFAFLSAGATVFLVLLAMLAGISAASNPLADPVNLLDAAFVAGLA
jgi:hypothetical protein